MYVRTEKKLTDSLRNTYHFRFDDGYPADLIITQGDAAICVDAKEVKPFLRELNSFYANYHKPKSAR